MTRLLRAALPLALLALGGCRTPECTYDTDCEALQWCDEGSCAPIDLRAATRGDCAAASDCSYGEVCEGGRCLLPVEERQTPCRSERDPVCPDGQLCRIVDAEPCVEGEACDPPLACVAPVGETESLRRCAADEECASGRCLDQVCVRVCNDTIGCPPGFDCLPLPLDGGREAGRCVGRDSDGSSDPSIAICRADADCPPGRACRFVDPSSCDAGGMVASCTTVPPSAWASFSSSCGALPEDRCDLWQLLRAEACPTQLCAPACERESTAPSYVCDDWRCSMPCEATRDCPMGTLCRQVGNDIDADGAPVKLCGVMEGGCWDQVHCCPTRGPEGGCVGGWGTIEGHCGLQPVGPVLLRNCVLPDDRRALPEAPCATDEECLTGLCEPMLDGLGSRCTTLCDPGFDRCGQRQPGRRCVTPTVERLPGLVLCR